MRKVLAFAVVATATLGIGFAGTTVKAAEPAQNIDISKMKVNWSDEFNGTELNLTVTIGLRRLEMETGAGETMRKNTIKQTTYLYQMEQ